MNDQGTRTIVFVKEVKPGRVFNIHSKTPKVKGTVKQVLEDLDALEKYLAGMELLINRSEDHEMEIVFRVLKESSLPLAKGRASDAEFMEQDEQLLQKREQIRCLADIKSLVLEEVKRGVKQILDWSDASHTCTWTKETLDGLRSLIDSCCGALSFFPPLAIVEGLEYSESFGPPSGTLSESFQAQLKVQSRDAWSSSIRDPWDMETDRISNLGELSTKDWDPLGIYPPPEDFLSGEVGLLSESKNAFLVELLSLQNTELQNRFKSLQEHGVEEDAQTEASRVTVARLEAIRKVISLVSETVPLDATESTLKSGTLNFSSDPSLRIA